MLWLWEKQHQSWLLVCVTLHPVSPHPNLTVGSLPASAINKLSKDYLDILLGQRLLRDGVYGKKLNSTYVSPFLYFFAMNCVPWLEAMLYALPE